MQYYFHRDIILKKRKRYISYIYEFYIKKCHNLIQINYNYLINI